LICAALPSGSVLEGSGVDRFRWGLDSPDFDDRVGSSSPAPVQEWTPPPAAGSSPQEPAPKSKRTTYVVIAVVIVVVMLVAAYALTNGFRRPTSSPAESVLVPQGADYSLPVAQFNGVTITVNSGNATVNGTIVCSYGLQLYTMTPAQFEYLSIKGDFDGYEWTSGVLANDTIYNINLVFGPGQWVVVFYNPNPVHTFLTTSVGFYTNLVLIT
jgi:hypothetical protein